MSAAPANTPAHNIDGNKDNESNSYMGSGKWETGLFGCFGDVSLCLLTCCCTCVPGGRTLSVATAGTNDGSGMWICIYFASMLVGVNCCAEWYSRSKLRDKYSIDGSAIKDCAVTCCCYCCVVQQHARQTGQRGCKGPGSADM
mmetsp:Transcript_44357/g.79565  ORF Transcript_44357/g.79565 Transcript_44357/m.79565 type:complete len:143 (-) Transcript_44357:406-834(-)